MSQRSFRTPNGVILTSGLLFLGDAAVMPSELEGIAPERHLRLLDQARPDQQLYRQSVIFLRGERAPESNGRGGQERVEQDRLSQLVIDATAVEPLLKSFIVANCIQAYRAAHQDSKKLFQQHTSPP
jgi:hypothetical protein